MVSGRLEVALDEGEIPSPCQTIILGVQGVLRASQASRAISTPRPLIPSISLQESEKGPGQRNSYVRYWVFHSGHSSFHLQCALWNSVSVIILYPRQVFVSLSCPDGNLADFLGDCFSCGLLKFFPLPFGTTDFGDWILSFLLFLAISRPWSFLLPNPHPVLWGAYHQTVPPTSLPHVIYSLPGYACHLLKSFSPSFSFVIILSNFSIFTDDP